LRPEPGRVPPRRAASLGNDPENCAAFVRKDRAPAEKWPPGKSLKNLKAALAAAVVHCVHTSWSNGMTETRPRTCAACDCALDANAINVTIAGRDVEVCSDDCATKLREAHRSVSRGEG